MFLRGGSGPGGDAVNLLTLGSYTSSANRVAQVIGLFKSQATLCWIRRETGLPEGAQHCFEVGQMALPIGAVDHYII